VLALRAHPRLRELIGSLTHLLRPTAGAARLPLWNPADVQRYDNAFVGNQEIDGDGAPRPRFAQVLHDELANGLDADRQWLNVLRQLATQGLHIDDVVLGTQGTDAWQQAALATVQLVSGVPATTQLAPAQVPPHFEVSLQRLAV
jgi:hypothetical protein